MQCSIDDCDKRSVARSMCSKHYTRWYNHGNPRYVRPKRTCSFEGCDKPHDQHGYCHTHAARLWRTGRVEDRELVDNLTRHTVEDNGCWLWTGPVFQSSGYGQTSREINGTKLAHRAYFIEANGPIPADAVLDHLCRNKLCVNPHHLDVVTTSENVRRGLTSYALRTLCRNGLHDITRPGAWYVAPGDGSRTCYQCARAKWARQDAKRARRRAQNQHSERHPLDL